MSREHGPVGLAIEWSPRGVVAYDANTQKTQVAESLADLNLGGREAVLALSRRGVFVRTARVPNAGAEEVRMVLMMQVGDLFPIPTIDLAWSFVLTDDVTPDGRLAVLAAVPCADLRRALEAASAANVRIKASVPLAFGATLLAAELGLAEAAVVESADDGPAVDVVSGGSLRASRAAPPTGSMALEVTRALGLAGLADAPVVAAGDAAVTDAAHRTQRNALIALADTPFERLKLRLELPEAVAARATAAGRAQMRIALMTLAGSALVALYAYSNWSDAAAVRDITEVAANGRLQKLRNDEKKAKAESSKLAATRVTLDKAFDPPQRISEIVALTSTSVPQGAWLTSLTVERGRPVALRGFSKQASLVSELAQRLDRNPEGRFRDVKIASASNNDVNNVPVTDFVLNAFPVGNLPFLSRSSGKAR